MQGLYFLLPTFITIFVSFLIIRAAAIALMITGLDKNKARFQALSAFSGTGFTTREAESVTNHPLRRRIISILMILGNAGIVTVIVTTTSSFATSSGYLVPVNAALLVAGIFVIYRIVTRKGLVQRWEGFIEGKLVRSKVFEEGATEDLLHLVEGYGLVKSLINKDSPLVGSTLAKANLTAKGILVLGIERENGWVPIPKAHQKIEADDKLVVYGALDKLREIISGETKKKGA